MSHKLAYLIQFKSTVIHVQEDHANDIMAHSDKQ